MSRFYIEIIYFNLCSRVYGVVLNGNVVGGGVAERKGSLVRILSPFYVIKEGYIYMTIVS